MQTSLNSAAYALQQTLCAARGWEQRYRELLQIGKQAPNNEHIRTPEFQVQGCQAKVWLQVNVQEGGMQVLADSDARLVKALLQVMITPLQGQPLEYLAQFDFSAWLAQCQLADHLSASRVNGLHQMALALKAHAPLA